MVRNCGLCNAEISDEQYQGYGLCDICIYGELIYEEEMERAHIITREMALDAGDPELEGHEW